MTETMAGRPRIQEWERVRVRAWTDLIRRMTQNLMNDYLGKKLKAGATFFPLAQMVYKRWQVPQRKSQFANTVTMTDLGEIYLGIRGSGQTRTDFSAYRTGVQAQPKDGLLRNIDNYLPGTFTYYDVGPYGLPLWQAFNGKTDDQNFWSPLITSNVFNTLEWQRKKSLTKGLDEVTWEKSGLMAVSDDEWLELLLRLDTDTLEVDRLFGPAVLFAGILCKAVNSAETALLIRKIELLKAAGKFDSVWPTFDIGFGPIVESDAEKSGGSFVAEFINTQLEVIENQLESAENNGLL